MNYVMTKKNCAIGIMSQYEHLARDIQIGMLHQIAGFPKLFFGRSHF